MLTKLSRAVDDVFGVRLVNDIPAHRRVGAVPGAKHVRQVEAAGAQAMGVDLDGVFDVVADAGHLGHAWNRGKLRSNIPILHRSQAAEVVA
jgi:hypothetical protein